MKGSIYYRKDRRRYCVQFIYQGKRYIIAKYNGEYMYHRSLAEKLLACMQADVERNTFRIEKYLYQKTDVIPYLEEWLEAIKNTLSPATHRDYNNSIQNHLNPWFEKNPVSLHEIQYDVLCNLLTSINRQGKGKLNVLYCLRACLTHAWKSGRIPAMPPFPERKKYQISENPIRWLPEERQVAVIKAIPEIHQPIFWWMKYHLRRPSEAMALYKEDYDKRNDVFTIRRSFSNKKLVERTKTGVVHTIPCHPGFRFIMEKLSPNFSPFLFTNPNGKLKGKHYQHDYLVDLWNKACKQVGENIDMYSGLKHSSCSQYINEKGLSIDELQMLTDHSRRESVLRYADVIMSTKRRLMMTKVIDINGSSSGVLIKNK